AFEDLSDREMELRLMFDMAIKRFVGVPMSFTGFDHSTLGLDRERMGTVLFDACFHYILSQAKQHKLWGAKDERWLIDSFHTHANAVKMSAYRLVFHGMLNVVQQLKRAYRPLFNLLEKTLRVSSWFKRLPASLTPEQRIVAFSKLVARAYGLLTWLDSEAARPLFWKWEADKKQLRSLELQAILWTILQQNTRKNKTIPKEESPSKAENSDGDTPGDLEKIPRSERPLDRIENAHDPEMRSGNKTPTKRFFGDKIQVVEEDHSHFILEVQPIPGNEHDGQCLQEIVSRIIEIHEVTPIEMIGDSHYGSGSNRLALQENKITLIAPVPNFVNTRGLLSNNHFTYDEGKQNVTCPEGNTTSKRIRQKLLGGFQFKFASAVCSLCPRLKECTASPMGRTIFINDNYKLIKEAEEFNLTQAGQDALNARYKIERTNNELANHHGLRKPRTRGRNKLNIISKLKGMAINVKLMVKTLGNEVKDPFIRYKRTKRITSVCS
ncbi:unnamed protein product, partial [Aphanomyces euteiches]